MGWNTTFTEDFPDLAENKSQYRGNEQAGGTQENIHVAAGENTLRVLIVDDLRSDRKHLASLLSPFMPIVVEAADGLEAYNILENDQNFDMVITDVEMPRMDGYQLCEKLKYQDATKAIPLIIVSVFDSDSSIERGFEAGASAYISKGEVQNRLHKVVAQVLSKSALVQCKNILVVDDSPVIRKIVENNLSKQGYRICVAENGKQAMEKLKTGREQYDLILSDIKMPEMDGIKLCGKVKSDARLSKIPFIVMTASEERRYAKQLVQQGIAGYIVKPFEPDELNILLERIFSEQYQLILKDREKLALERNLLLSSITSLVNALEARDQYTRGHSESVADIITGMAGIAGSNDEEIQLLHIGGRLHDIGKIGVRDAVLLKPGALTTEEYEHIKNHSVVGAKILQSIPSLSEIIPLVLHHHERYDGRGYPFGLKAEKIPYWARMAAVADTYDAMTNDRPYRKRMSSAKALEIIKEISGAQLCPECVGLFMQWIEAKG